jgi:hypothetical protein
MLLTYTGHSGSFTGDGRQDLLVRNAKTGELLVHPHTGRVDGTDTYGPAVLIGEGYDPDFYVWVGSAHFTSEKGPADIFVLTSEEEGYIRVNQGGLGLDTLSEPIAVGGKLPGIAYDTIALADLNADGKTDILGREGGTGFVDTIPFTGTVDGMASFTIPYRLSVIEEDEIPVGAADLTGDGRPDLLVLRPNGELTVREPIGDEPNGDTALVIGTGWDQYRITVVTDLNGDGRPDLLTLTEDGTLLAHTHTGSFDPGDPPAVFNAPIAVATGWTDYDAIG